MVPRRNGGGARVGGRAQPAPRAHFALAVDDLDAAIQTLRASGCHIEQARPIPGRRRCFTRDPAGNRIELLAYDEAPATVVYEELAGGPG